MKRLGRPILLKLVSSWPVGPHYLDIGLGQDVANGVGGQRGGFRKGACIVIACCPPATRAVTIDLSHAVLVELDSIAKRSVNQVEPA